jgi:hypothetical protein
VTTVIHSTNLPGWQGHAWHVEVDGEHFVVSGVDAMFSGWEVLAFPADKNGEVTDWLEVAGWRGPSATHEAVVAALEQREREEAS